MSFLRSTVAYWVGLFNTSQATLTTRTTERDSARNAQYVSGVYQSGQTWQSKDAADLASYNSEVTLYNGMVADRDTWQGRANNAWGASRVWNSGTSFETALAAKTTSTVSTTVFTAQSPLNSTSAYLQVASLSAPRTGAGQASARVRITSTVGTHGQARIKVNGAVVATGPTSGHNSGSGTPDFFVSYAGSFNSGDTVTVEVAADGGAASSAAGDFNLTVGSV